MIKIKEYIKVSSLEEAYTLNQQKSSVILGGMLWLKMQNRTVKTAIDLSALGLDKIEETDTEFRIGAMVTLRQLETHAGLNTYTQNAVRDSVKSIVGVQFRNMATIGGSIFGRYGFSDVLTVFMALGAKVELYHGGIVSVEEFAGQPYERDILVSVILPKQEQKAIYLSQRNTKTDFPVLTCCVVRDEAGYRCVIGARPGKAKCFRDEKGILAGGIHPESAAAFGEYVKENVGAGSNLRAGREYRERIAQVLVKRAVLALAEL